MDARTKLFVVPVLLLTGCSSSAPDQAVVSSEPLPDLIIRRVTARMVGPSNRIRTTGVIYEFRIRIENIGTEPFNSPFYLSYTTSETDHSANIYSRNERLNESRAVILPNQNFTFVVNAEIEMPRRTASLQIRFLINTEGGAGVLGPLTHVVRELDYKNNVYEYSLRLSGVRRN